MEKNNIKYVRVILNEDNVDKIINKYDLNKKVEFAFYDLIYVNKNGKSLTEDTLKIRVYQINEWKNKNVLVIKKDAPIINGQKEDRVLLKEEFDSEEEAIKFVNSNYLDNYDFSFKLEKNGIQYGNNNVDVWKENVTDVGLSIEIGSSDEKIIEDILSDLDIKERLDKSLPEYMYEKNEYKKRKVMGKNMSKFTKEMVDDYADKLLIGLTDEENQMVLDEFEIIDETIDLINEIKDIEKVEPMTHTLDDFEYELREDVVEESVPIEELLQNCDDTSYNEIRVPKVVN